MNFFGQEFDPWLDRTPLLGDRMLAPWWEEIACSDSLREVDKSDGGRTSMLSSMGSAGDVSSLPGDTHGRATQDPLWSAGDTDGPDMTWAGSAVQIF